MRHPPHFFGVKKRLSHKVLPESRFGQPRQNTKRRLAPWVFAAAVGLSACGGNSNDSDLAALIAAQNLAAGAGATTPATVTPVQPSQTAPSSNPPATRLTIGGKVQGLLGDGLLLQNNAGDDLPITSDGSFVFASALANGATYAVRIKSQPTILTRTCRVDAGSGQVNGAPVGDVVVNCRPRKARFAFAVNSNTGSVTSFTIDPVNGSLAPLAGAPVAAGSVPFGIATHPNGRFAYVTDIGSQRVLAYDIDPTTGQLTPMTVPSIPSTGQGPTTTAIDPTGRYLFVTNRFINTLSGYLIDSTSGALSPMPTPTVAVGATPSGVSIDALGRFLYVTNAADDTISQMRISPTAVGTPLVPATVATAVNPSAVAADPEGRFIFIVDQPARAAAVHAYRADPNSGILTSASTLPIGLQSQGLAVDPSGRFIVAANFLDRNASNITFDRTAAVLTAAAPPVVPTGLGPACVAFNPDGLSVYVCNNGVVPGSITQFDVDAATGALRQKLAALVPTGGSGVQSMAFAP